MPRFRLALGITFVLSLASFATALAKGSFAFITISGPGLSTLIRSTDPALTIDFFAFADFDQDPAKAPTDPGQGYEITRYYIDHGHDAPFDRLHYYPSSGWVFFDGLVNGDTSWDGHWFQAATSIQPAFEKALMNGVNRDMRVPVDANPAPIRDVQTRGQTAIEEVHVSGPASERTPSLPVAEPYPAPASTLLAAGVVGALAVGILGVFFLRRSRS